MRHTVFLIGGFFKLFGKKFLFDHHDINPELYEAKFGRRDLFHRLLGTLERWTFRCADVSISLACRCCQRSFLTHRRSREGSGSR